jgi:hypothetical protein
MKIVVVADRRQLSSVDGEQIKVHPAVGLWLPTEQFWIPDDL